VQREVADRLEDLLVAPADLPRLLMEMEGGWAFGVERLFQVVQQRCLLLVGRGEAAGAGDLVEAESRPAGRLGVLGDAVVVLAVLGDRQGDPLARRLGEDAAAKLRAHARVGTQYGRSAGEDADELGYRAARSLDRLDQRGALVRSRQLV